MSCSVGTPAGDATTTAVQVMHCSGDSIVFLLAAGRYENPQQRAATYLRLCYVHEPLCPFRTFTA
jgi:hypothetical protein